MLQPLSSRPAALVTGGAIRLGRAIVLALAQAGYDIALHYGRSEAAALETQAAVRALGVRCELFPLDLAQCRDFHAYFQPIRATFPRLALLVNSASGYIQSTIRDSRMEDFDALFAANLRAPFFLTQAFAAVVDQGQVINIIDNKIGFNQFNYAHYLLTKKALAELTRMAALEYAPRLRVNGVAPGVTLPAGSRSEAYLQWRINAIPLKRKGETSHITDTIQFLLANEFINGQILVVDGAENIAQLGLNAGDFDPAGV